MLLSAAAEHPMDRATLRTHLEHLHRESYGWAVRCCADDPAAAADVLQTAYLKILEGTARYDGKASFKTWFFAVIRNTAADARRRRRLRLVRRNDVVQALPSKEQPTDALDRAQRQALFRQALDALSDRQREVLHLVMYHDLTLAEAAQVMGVSLGSARTHYDRGKKRLRKRLEATGAFEPSGYGS